MGETDIRGNIIQGDGVYKSTDAGKTWTHIGLADTQAIAKIRVHPTNPDIVYVAAFGHHAAPNAERGVFRSKDGGKTWEKILFRDDKTGAIDLVIDPNNPQRAVRRALGGVPQRRTMLSSGGPGSGLFKSTDGGDHWTEITRNPGLPNGDARQDRRRGLGRRLATASTRMIEARGRRLLRVRRCRRDVEAGERRAASCGSARSTTRASSPIPKVKDTVYVLNVGFYQVDRRRQDVDARCSAPHGDNHDMWIAPNDPKRMIEAQRRRRERLGQRRRDAGRTRTYPTAQFYHVITTTRRAVSRLRRAAGQQHGVRVEPGGGGFGGRRRRSVFYSVGGGESGYIAPRPAQPRHLLRRQLRRPDHALRPHDRPAARGQSVSRQPDGLRVDGHRRALPVDVPDRVSRRSIRACSTSARSTSGRRPTKARAGQRISPDLTRARSEDDGRFGRPDHAGPNRRRDLRDDLHDRAVARRTAT